jgi:uncharacterized membrane protein
VECSFGFSSDRDTYDPDPIFSTEKIFGVQVALIALLLLAVSPWHIFWSQNARFYTSLMLFYAFALFSYFYGIESDRPLYIFAFIVLFYLAVSERLPAVFLFPVVLGYLLLLKILPFEKPSGLRYSYSWRYLHIANIHRCIQQHYRVG